MGYLPFLVHGASLVTRAGTNITVNISGADTFINDARIVHANLVLDNGVAHVLDRVSFSVERRHSFQYPRITYSKYGVG